ncbi:TPA: hypothetical protein ACORG0_005510, partial [Pseudomonas aeruginosa]
AGAGGILLNGRAFCTALCLPPVAARRGRRRKARQRWQVDATLKEAMVVRSSSGLIKKLS